MTFHGILRSCSKAIGFHVGWVHGRLTEGSGHWQCQCDDGANSALLTEYCTSCQKHRCTSCAMSPRPSKERRQKQKKAGGATKTGPPASKTGATGTNTESQSPPGAEAQQQPCRRSHSGTPSPLRASLQFGHFANEGGRGLIPTSDHLLSSPSGSLESPASIDLSSIEPAHPASVTSFNGPTSPHVPSEALLSDLHHETFLTELPYVPPLPEYNYEALPALSWSITQETHRNASLSFSPDSYQDTSLSLSNPQGYYHPSDSHGNTPISSSSPSDALNLTESTSCSYGPKSPSGGMGSHDGFQQISHPSTIGYVNNESQSSPEKAPAHPPSKTTTGRALTDKPALVTEPKAETGVSSKSPTRHGLPSNKRKWEDEGQGPRGFPSYDGTAPRHDKNLACPFYKMNPKKYMGCGERSISNISALGQHLRQSHKLKPHSCQKCFEPYDDEESLCLHRESGRCRVTGGCAVDDLTPVPRKCKGQWETWFWYWNELFPSLTPPASPYTDGLEVVGQFALFAIENVLSPSALDESLKGELIRRMLMVSKRWREDPSAPLDYSELSSHMHSGLPANRNHLRGR